MTLNVSDTSTWLPLDGLAPGFDANKASPVTDLNGQSYQIDSAQGIQNFEFTTEGLRWQAGEQGGLDEHEVFAVAPELYYVQWQQHDALQFSGSLLLDLETGRALFVAARLVYPDQTVAGQTAVDHKFVPGVISGRQPSGAEIAPSRALIGRRVQWVYSETHAYEHIYLSEQWYTWQCLAGPERGLADTDQNTVYEIRPGIYLFSWREKVIPCGSITVADHRDVNNIRSHGALFGWDESGTVAVHFSFGAYGKLISVTSHPEPYEPAQWDAS
ncbi:hypothetical protein FHU41_000966 [Psychromicrobium silvestre]|uniref:Molybdenum cofactor biosynthesis protein F n=1 Tax=Psychromicrobium silvestre TaxID=1645614 RepID=A0A7Y9S5Z6_9MICC|nr:MoaF C-terminal domain-containing protein [Psychromicrobium silvestre]NYE94745.1 hypothetical protein [Psychromicrobium silvestre]